jgi:hypothetical protein
MAKKSKKQKQKKKSGTVTLKKDSGTLVLEHETLKNITLGSNAGDQDERIYNVLDVEVGEDDDDDDAAAVNAAVNDKNLKKYLEHLKKETIFPVTVTGIEDMGCFGWEEFYTWGPGDKAEYENLKKKYPSFTDKYELLRFNEDFDLDEGLYAEVKRISDRKKFTLSLADLKTVEKNSKNSQLLDDYAVWYTNFR